MRRSNGSLIMIACVLALGGCAAGREGARPVHAGTAATAPASAPEPLYRQMTDADVTMANAALDRSLERNPSGTPAAWRNRGSGNGGSITPLRTWKTAAGVYCRDYREVVDIGRASEAYTAAACRQTDGLWQPVN
jgi:surface antigen